VADLPQQLNGYQGDCETSENISCGGRDNASNFMNLSEDACLAMFTQGQAMRMQAALIGARSGLLNDNACEPNSPIVSGDEFMNGSTKPIIRKIIINN